MIVKFGFWFYVFSKIVYAKEINNIIHKETNSWITQDDFKTMLKVSFPFAKCCNVFINGSTDQLEQIFAYFVKTYSNDYTLMRRTYDCQGYLLIASEKERLLSALDRVPSAISTTELLIIFHDHLPKDSKLFNGSLYRNANANLVTISGIWSLSENFLENRTFEKVESYEELRYKNGLADFKGRELYAAAYYNPPMFYLNETVNKTVKGIEAEMFLTENKIQRDGFELNIFMLIAEKLNFTWTIRKPSGGYRYGRRHNDTWEGGMIGQLVAKEIDVAFSGIWMKEDHNVFTNLSIPFGQLLIKFLVPRPKPCASLWALTKPFTPLVWAMIFIILVWQTCYMTIRSRIKPTESTVRFRKFSNTFMELSGRLVGIPVERKMSGVKIQLQFWQAAGLIIVTAYSSSLAARLAAAEYQERIDTVQQLLEAGLTWGRQGPEPLFNEFFDLQNKYSAILPSRFKHENNSEDRRKKIAKGNYAIVGRIIGGGFFPEDNVANDDLQKYRLMKETVGSYYSCFAMQPWLLPKIDKILLRIIESGLADFHLKDVIHRRTGSSLREVLIEHDKNDGTPRVLALAPLAAGFVLLFSGLTIASLVLYLEMRSVSESKNLYSRYLICEKIKKKYNKIQRMKLNVQIYIPQIKNKQITNNLR